MAETKGNITEHEINAPAVVSTTEEVPSEADASSAPGPYVDEDGKPLDVQRPPVSTNDPETPIAQSLVAGAGAPTGEPEIHPETHVASNAYVQPGDKVEPVNAPALDSMGRPVAMEAPAAASDGTPADSASRAEWDDYARARGLDPSDYSSKEDLQAALK